MRRFLLVLTKTAILCFIKGLAWEAGEQVAAAYVRSRARKVAKK